VQAPSPPGSAARGRFTDHFWDLIQFWRKTKGDRMAAASDAKEANPRHQPAAVYFNGGQRGGSA